MPACRQPPAILARPGPAQPGLGSTRAARPVAAAGAALVARLALMGLILAAVTLTGCGRSAPEQTLSAAEADPAIAGVSITSPDVVVVGTPGAVGAPVTSVTTAPAVAGSYTVKSGDTLSQIAKQFGTTTQALADANGIADAKSIKAGQQLVIPAPSTPSTSAPGPATTLLKP